MFCIVALRPNTNPPVDNKEIIGAWGYGTPENRTVMINTDKVFSVATYDIPGKKFISSYGGTWRIDNNKFIKKIEWHSMDSAMVGKEITGEAEIKDGKLITTKAQTKHGRGSMMVNPVSSWEHGSLPAITEMTVYRSDQAHSIPAER